MWRMTTKFPWGDEPPRKSSLQPEPKKRNHGLPRALSYSQYLDACWKVLHNHTIQSVADELGCGVATLYRMGIKEDTERIRAIAKEKSIADAKMAQLPVVLQVPARILSDELTTASLSLASAAKHGAFVADKLAQFAATEAEKIDFGSQDEDQVKANVQALRSIDALTGVANNAADIGLKLINASNKDKLREREPTPADPNAIPGNDQVTAQQVYQRMLNPP